MSLHVFYWIQMEKRCRLQPSAASIFSLFQTERVQQPVRELTEIHCCSLEYAKVWWNWAKLRLKEEILHFFFFCISFLKVLFQKLSQTSSPSMSSVISRSLVPVTQLYVSVDASTKDSLKKIDRPLFKDFWPRFLDCLKALGEKVSCPLSEFAARWWEGGEPVNKRLNRVLLWRKMLLKKSLGTQI